MSVTHMLEVSAKNLRTRARISAHAVFDILARPCRDTVDPTPWHAPAITPDWLTEHVGRDRGVRALGVEVTGGDNGSSVRRSLTVDWSRPAVTGDLPRHLFVKVTPTALTRISSGMAARAEGFALTAIRPDLAIEAPVCLYSSRDSISGRSIHLFEDLRAHGVTFCNHTTVIDRARADGIVDLLAELHGTYLSPRVDREQVDALPLPRYEQFFDVGKAGGTDAGHEAAITQAAHLVPDRLLKRRDEIWPAAERARDAHAAAPRTVIHSDVHLGNWYITPDGRMGLADWACACKGLWARDVAYAVTTALAIDDRRRWEMAMLDRYLRCLRDRFGVTVEVDEALRAYRQQMFAALVMWTPTLCPAPGFPDMQPEATSLEMIHRICTAIDDHQALDAI
ncbi:MAG: phosphotransferase [Gammaproteobacteria bacterium]|nr:phosphotransferase [Gammaproteobacteria bacterium]MYE81530.1 phosphotransferase [Gammaproteobacteria bacterium]